MLFHVFSPDNIGDRGERGGRIKECFSSCNKYRASYIQTIGRKRTEKETWRGNIDRLESMVGRSQGDLGTQVV